MVKRPEEIVGRGVSLASNGLSTFYQHHRSQFPPAPPYHTHHLHYPRRFHRHPSLEFAWVLSRARDCPFYPRNDIPRVRNIASKRRSRRCDRRGTRDRPRGPFAANPICGGHHRSKVLRRMRRRRGGKRRWSTMQVLMDPNQELLSAIGKENS